MNGINIALTSITGFLNKYEQRLITDNNAFSIYIALVVKVVESRTVGDTVMCLKDNGLSLTR